jgi:hypothetical protein
MRMIVPVTESLNKPVGPITAARGSARYRVEFGTAKQSDRAPWRMIMQKWLGVLAIAAIALPAVADPALAQKSGGILRIYHRDSPASMSIHEEGTIGVIMPMMGVFNNVRSEYHPEQ